jgi:hypothetical protein
MRLNPYLVRPGLALVTGVQGDGGDETEPEGGTQDAGEQEADIEAGAEIEAAQKPGAAKIEAAEEQDYFPTKCELFKKDRRIQYWKPLSAKLQWGKILWSMAEGSAAPLQNAGH